MLEADTESFENQKAIAQLNSRVRYIEEYADQVFVAVKKLQNAVSEAVEGGDGLAAHVNAPDALTLLDNLTSHFKNL